MTLPRINLLFGLTGAIAMVGLVASHEAYAEEQDAETDTQAVTADEEPEAAEDQELSPIDNVRKCVDHFPRGVLCTQKMVGGYNAEFYTYGTGMSAADFNLEYHSGSFGSSGAFSIGANDYRSYFFAVGDVGCGRAVLWDRAQGQPPLYGVADCE